MHDGGEVGQSHGSRQDGRPLVHSCYIRKVEHFLYMTSSARGRQRAVPARLEFTAVRLSSLRYGTVRAKTGYSAIFKSEEYAAQGMTHDSYS